MTGRGRGRPPKAAQSLDEALRRHYAGESPARARNDIERQVMGKGRNGKRGGGRHADPMSPTQTAAQLAAYLVASDGVSLRTAATRAAALYKVNADNVRKYAARVRRGPTIDMPVRVDPVFSQLVGGCEFSKSVPLLDRVEDIPAG